MVKLREWAEQESKAGGSGERDNAPRHTDRVWRQVSVNHRECLGATKCPFAQECFAERAKEKAQQSHLIVTNHSLLAIDAIEGVPMIPDYDAVVIDEAHELTARVTQAATDELSAPDVERAARRAQRHIEGDQADDLADAGDALADALSRTEPGRIDTMGEQLSDALVLVRDAARSAASRRSPRTPPHDADAGRTQAKGFVAGRVRQRRADGSPRRGRRALAQRGPRPHPRPAPRRAAPGVGADARQAAHGHDRRLHLGHPDARR